MVVADNFVWYALAGVGVLSLVLCLVALIQGRRLARVERRYSNLLTGVDGANLEQVLNQHLDITRRSSKLALSTAANLEEIEARLRMAIQHVGVVRFNPFADTGGDLSFALAVADADGYGFVLSSLHGRGDARAYIKPLSNWSSSYALSDEELQAVSSARQSRRKPELLTPVPVAAPD
ncbi:MAG: DUF4446 family protein [Anaerolineae bacterium]